MNYSKAHKAHPWHGISLGNNVPEEVRAFIEIVPTDTVKYEVDKDSGYLTLDRPQKFSNIVPSLYGFLPRTYCGPKMAELTNKALVRTDIEGDGDPLDICILTEKDVTHGDIIAKARPIGGLRLRYVLFSSLRFGRGCNYRLLGVHTCQYQPVKML